jgi:predicted phosphoribosyltransferase
MVKKIGYPGQPEFAVGAVTEDGTVSLNKEMLPFYRQKANYVEQAIERTKINMKQAIMKFRQGRTLDLRSKMVILVDDGIATGETMKAAIEWITSEDRSDHPKKVVVAVPVCSPTTVPEIEKLVDKFICIAIPEPFWAVSQFYWEFDPVDDEQVIEYLSKNRELLLPTAN